MTLRLGAYTRLSKDRNGTETATKRQATAIDKWAKEYGHKIVARYRDSDLSGYKRNVVRPEFQRLLADLDEGVIDGVVVWRTDRFTRQPIEIERFLEMAERNGCQLFSVTEPFDNSTMGFYMLRAFVNNHNFESAVKSDRLKAKAEELALAGKVGNGGVRPFGFEVDRRTLREDEAQLIRDAVAELLAGASLYSIAERWATDGVTTPSGKRWGASELRRVLTSGRVCGMRTHRGAEVAEAEWPAIITVEQRDQLRATLATRWSGATRDHYVRSHLLTGFLECALCGRRLVAQRHNGVSTYVCVKSAVTGACGKVRVRGAELDDHVGRVVTEAWTDGRVTRALRKAPARDERAAMAEVRALEAKEAELADQWAKDELTTAAWTTARRRVEERLGAARRRLDQLRRVKAAATLPVTGMPEAWEALDLHQRRAVIDFAIERIQIRPVGKGSHKPVRERVRPTDITWRV